MLTIMRITAGAVLACALVTQDVGPDDDGGDLISKVSEDQITSGRVAALAGAKAFK